MLVESTAQKLHLGSSSSSRVYTAPYLDCVAFLLLCCDWVNYMAVLGGHFENNDNFRGDYGVAGNAN